MSMTHFSLIFERISPVKSHQVGQPIHDLVDKSKELRVLDAKAAQNFGRILILLQINLSIPSLFSNHVQSIKSSTITLSRVDAFM